MRTIRNLTARPLRVTLHGGKILHLGPRNEGQIATGDLESPGVKRLIDSASIEVLGEGGGAAREPEDTSAHADNLGHHPDLTVRKRGDR